MYFMAKSYAEKLNWMKTIQSILTQNIQHDPMFADNRTALANTLIDEYNRRHCQQWEPSGRISFKSIEESNSVKISTNSSTYTQVNWWKLLPELISSSQSEAGKDQCQEGAPVDGHNSSISLKSTDSISHLVTVIQYHQEEVINSIISLLDDKSLSVLSSLLTVNKYQHYPIASGWFYEGNPKISTFSNQDFIRPILLRLFLFHDLLLVAIVPTKESKKLTYYFHIQIEDLQVLDYVDSLSFSSVSSLSTSSSTLKTTKETNQPQLITSNDQESFLTSQHQSPQQKPSSNSLGIKLIDHSVKSKGFLSSLWSSGGTSRERILLAPTMEQKLSWVELLTEAIRSLKNFHSPFHSSRLCASSSQQDTSHVSQGSSKQSQPLIRRISSYGEGAWKFDERVSGSEKNTETLL